MNSLENVCKYIQQNDIDGAEMTQAVRQEVDVDIAKITRWIHMQAIESMVLVIWKARFKRHLKEKEIYLKIKTSY